jgi:hypothetical protein
MSAPSPPAAATLSLALGAPSHAVEPALLAQRLPRLAAALHGFTAAKVSAQPVQSNTLAVKVYAAQLGVQRDHITLECLPALDYATFTQLQAITERLAGEFAADGLVLTATPYVEQAGLALGAFNRSAALPPTASFIGRDIAHALPRSDGARVLRQFVNAAQMALHLSPIAGSAVNSLWCANGLPTDGLSHSWLQHGLTAWWDALPAWDAALEVSPLNTATQLNLAYSDVTLTVPLRRRAAWQWWRKPLDLATVLKGAHV